MQLWDMFGTIMLLPGFFVHFLMGIPGNGSVCVVVRDILK